MMITIFGLPANTLYHEVKVLIKRQCNIGDFILDSLTTDTDGTKKIRVGLADDAEASHLIKTLDGYCMGGNMLKLIPYGKAAASNIQQHSYNRGNYQENYPNQYDRNAPADSYRPAPAPWESSGHQWSPNPQAMQNNYGMQQQVAAAPYQHQANLLVKSQFDQREAIPRGGTGPHNQSYGYNPKSNLISLSGPQANAPSNIRQIPEARPVQPGRYQSQGYDMPSEKPMTIAKDHFQGPNQYNVTSNPNFTPQSQPSPWASQHEQQRPGTEFDKKSYDDRMHPNQRKTEMTKPNDHYKYDKSGRDLSPQRRGFRDDTDRRVSPRRSSPSGRHYPERQISPGRRVPPSSGRRNSPPGRRISPPGKRISPSGRRISPPGKRVSPPGRRISPPSRRISPPGRRNSPPGRRISPPGRRNSPPGRRISPPGRRGSPSKRQILPPGRQASPTGRQISPPGRHVPPASRQMSPPGRHIPPASRQMSPPGRHVPPASRRMSPPGRHIPPSSRQMSPPGRHVPPSGRQLSPSGRHVPPPGRQISPPGRYIPPTGRQISPPDRRVPTSGRNISPPSRHVSIMDRRDSPGRRMPVNDPVKHENERRFLSSGPIESERKEDYVRGRRMSPPGHLTMDRRDAGMSSHRRASPGRSGSPGRQDRFSPSRHGKSMEYQGERNKTVRPAYEPNNEASNEAIYSGGYRPNLRDEAKKYPPRQEHWQDREKFSSKANIDDRREISGMPKFDISRDKQISADHDIKRLRSPNRDRSPLRDRFKRHSPSPRSPRRSWALEKRRSPEIREPPPPPIWPQERSEYTQDRPRYPDAEMEKTSPIWQTREKRRDDFQSADERRKFDETRQKAMSKWKALATADSPQTSRYDDSKFDDRHDFLDSKDTRIPHSNRLEREDTRFKPDFEKKDDNMSHKKDDYAGRIEEKKKAILAKQEKLQKEIDEVYKRAIDFTKKTELFGKLEQKEDNFDDDRDRRDDSKDFFKGRREEYEADRRRDETRKAYDTSLDSKMEDAKKANDLAARNKATMEIAEKLMKKYCPSDLSNTYKDRVMNELRYEIKRKFLELFGNTEVSFIEMVVKFNSRISLKDQEKLFMDALSSLPSQYRQLKRSAQDDSDIAAKCARYSPESSLKEIETSGKEETISEWDIATLPQTMPLAQTMSMMTPVIMPVPSQYQLIPTYQELPQIPQVVEEPQHNGYTLYICKDDFQPIFEFETDQLKSFLIQKLIKVTETSQGWAPDFTLNKQHSTYRHEVLTRDERSRDWLLNLDFSEFQDFTVLVYTTEELWYERAAVWLPGHSKIRNIEPLIKLKLQNSYTDDVNIGKWKFVKKIVTAKGTRLYVDMPPASARALEKYGMKLSYELQKVNVFLKAIAIDKDVFDAGLNERSITVFPAPGSDPMPAISEHTDLVKMAFKGNKPLPLNMARKLKDVIVYKLFKYLEQGGKSRTDFVNYGLSVGGFFGILPENAESKKWLYSLDIGKIQRVPIVILGADESKTKYFKMYIGMPRHTELVAAKALARIQKSNKGVKGLHYNLWKNEKMLTTSNKVILEVQMDLESVETLMRLNYQLDYVVNGVTYDSLSVRPEHSKERLKEMIAKYKAEMKDTYDVANMDISSGSDEEVICLG